MRHAILSYPVARYMPLAISVIVSLLAVVEDLKHRRISNWFAVALFLLGLCCGIVHDGMSGAFDALFGAALGFLAFLLPYSLGGMGGGDVKLMAGFGALTGWGGIFPALLLVAATGGLLSLLVLGFQRSRGRVTPVSIPYAPAIVTGGLLVVVSQIGAR